MVITTLQRKAPFPSAAHRRAQSHMTQPGQLWFGCGVTWPPMAARTTTARRAVRASPEMHLSLIASGAGFLTPARAFHAVGSAAQTVRTSRCVASCRHGTCPVSSCPGRCTRGQAAPTRAMEVHLHISRAFGAFPNDDTKGEVPTPRAAKRPRTQSKS